jgi:hypothetical protein
MFFYLIIAVALLADDIASEESPTSSTAPGRRSATTDQEKPFLTPPRSEPHCRSSRAGHWPVSCLFCVGLPEMLLAAICSQPHSARACSPAVCAIDCSPAAAWSLRGRPCGPTMRSRTCGRLVPFDAMMSRWSLGSGVPPYHGTQSLKSCRRAPALLHAERRAGERLLPCIVGKLVASSRPSPPCGTQWCSGAQGGGPPPPNRRRHHRHRHRVCPCTPQGSACFLA